VRISVAKNASLSFGLDRQVYGTCGKVHHECLCISSIQRYCSGREKGNKLCTI
jgi:hypothetical protein